MVKLSPFATSSLRSSQESSEGVDNDEDTAVMEPNCNKNERRMKELCLKWVFPLKADGRQSLRSHWPMNAIMFDAFPDITVIGNGGKHNSMMCPEFEAKNKCKPKETAGQGQHFLLHNNNRNQKYKNDNYCSSDSYYFVVVRTEKSRWRYQETTRRKGLLPRFDSIRFWKRMLKLHIWALSQKIKGTGAHLIINGATTTGQYKGHI